MVPSRLLALAAPLLGLFAAAAAVGQEKGQDIGQDNGRKNGVGGAAGTGGLVGRSSPLQVVEPDDDDKDSTKPAPDPKPPVRFLRRRQLVPGKLTVVRRIPYSTPCLEAHGDDQIERF